MRRTLRSSLTLERSRRGRFLEGEGSVREWQAVVGLVSVARGATLMMGSLETGLPVNPVNEPVKVSRA